MAYVTPIYGGSVAQVDYQLGDPHWHVHITIANLAQAPDGTWLTVAADGHDLMRHAPAAAR